MWTLQTFLRRLIWAGMAPLLALGLAALTFNLWSAKTQRDQDLAQAARLTREHLDLSLQTEARALRLLAAALQHTEGQVTEAVYQQAQVFKDHFEDHVVVAHQGWMLMNTRVAFGAALAPMPVVQGRSALSVALATGGAAVGDLFTGPISQSPLLALAVPVGPPQAAAELVLVATMEAARFVQRLQQFPVPAGVRAQLFDSTGRLIASSTLADPPPALEGSLARHLGQRLELPLEAAPWRLVFETDGALEQARLLRDLALWLAALVAAAVAAYLAARGAGRHLEAGFRSLSPGEAPAPSPLDIAEIARTRQLLQRLDRERDEQEAALRASEHRAWALLRLMPEPVFVTREGLLEFVNGSGCALLGAPEEDLLGRRLLDFVHPQDRPSVQQGLAALPRTLGTQGQRESRICRRGGEVRAVLATVVRFELGDGLVTLSMLRDITQEKAAVQELERSRAELRWLLEQLTRAQEQERQRIALDLHDDLQQELASIQMSAAALREAEAAQQPARRQALAQAVEDQARQAVQSTRRIVEGLRPPALDALGLEAALKGLVERFGCETGLSVAFEVVGPGADERVQAWEPGDETFVAPSLAITLYRVAQEALNNVRKHAQARQLSVRLALGAHGQIELRVRDDGRGLSPTAPADTGSGSGLGLAGMRERMRAAGGSFQLLAAEGGGTEVVARAPNV